VSNAVIVKTRDHKTGELVRRVTFDFWPPNSRMDPGPQRVPLHHELADRARHAVLWDKDDGYSGYYQYALDEDSKYLTGVYTPLGIRVFNCMPMGIDVAPAVWNTAMAEKFKELPLNRLFIFMDDFMRFTNGAPGKTRAALEEEHLDLLDTFLTKVEEAKLKLKLPKAQHAQEEIEAIGMRWKDVEDRVDDKGRERVPAAAGSKADGAVPSAGQLLCPVCGQLRRSGGAPEGAGA
jgi:hypothetical protein